MKGVYLGLGSNLGDRAANMRMALRYLSAMVRVASVSSLYETPPVGVASQPMFYNAVCQVEAGLTPEALLRYTKQVEFEIGRRPGPPHDPRPIDIDILLWDDVAVKSDTLTVPHPRLAERAFVLVPLVEIAPKRLAHPVDGRPIDALLAELRPEDVAAIVKVAEPGWEQQPESASPTTKRAAP